MKTKMLLAAILVCAGIVARAQQPAAAQSKPELAAATENKNSATPLIPRKVIFGNPDKAAPQISPDGKHLAYLAAVEGVLNVWVSDADKPESAQPVTNDTKRGIRVFQWAYTNRHILYLQDTGGDENWRVYSTDIASKQTKDLTPVKGVQARIDAGSPKFPAEVLISINDRNPQFHDLYRVNIETGERKLVKENDGGFVGFMADDDFTVHLAVRVTPDGGQQILRWAGDWTAFMDIGADDSMTTAPEGFDKAVKVLYLRDSRGRDTAALTAVNLDGSGSPKVLAEDVKADIDGAMFHPTEKTLQAVASNYERIHWQFFDKDVEADFAALAKFCRGEVAIASRTLDDKTWIVAFTSDTAPVRYYRYDRASKKADFLFTNRKALENQPLAAMHPVTIKSRDGFNLVSYLTLPAGAAAQGGGHGAKPAAEGGKPAEVAQTADAAKSAGAAKPADGAKPTESFAHPDKPLPTVLLVHGGPWGRDDWGYDPLHQWLANRGYAVLAVNFRGSTGLGKKFINAANKEWAGRMHDDLLDAVQWAIVERIADPKRIAIMGGSYGGYATLVGLTFTPDVFACGVDIVGPSNLITLLETIPPYWKPMLDMFTTRVGDNRTDEGRALLTERSPLTYVDRIKRPLLIGQGANDPRVKQAESDQIVKAMNDKKIPVAYVLFPDEGHGFQRPENKMAFWAVTEAFLAQHLGGRAEPIGEDFKGSTITVPNGAVSVPGLAEALPKNQ